MIFETTLFVVKRQWNCLDKGVYINPALLYSTKCHTILYLLLLGELKKSITVNFEGDAT